MSSSDDTSSNREGDTASRSEEKTIRRRFASDLMSVSSSAMSSSSIGGSAYRSLARSRIFGSSAQSLNCVAIFPPFMDSYSGRSPWRQSHVFYDGSHSANRKILKIRG